MPSHTLFNSIATVDDLSIAFGISNNIQRKELLRQHVETNNINQLVKDCPTVTLYYVSYEAKLNLRALLAPVYPDMPKTFYLTLAQAEKVPNAMNVEKYVAIQLPTHKLNIEQLITQGRANLLISLKANEIAQKSAVNAKQAPVIKNDKQAKPDPIWQAFKRCFAG